MMLAGSRVLVVEDEALIAMGISAMVTEAEGGAGRTGPACARRVSSSGMSPCWTLPYGTRTSPTAR